MTTTMTVAMDTVTNELDLLRHSAEQTLVDMLESLFSRLPHLSSDMCNNDMSSDQVLMLPNEGTLSINYCSNPLCTLGDHMIRETEQSEGSVSDEEEVVNQSVHFALQQDKQSGDAIVISKQEVMRCMNRQETSSPTP